MLQEALKIINLEFKDKTDKGGKPYIGHLLRVANTIAENGGNERLQTIALLHDLLEDTHYTKEDLLKIFTEEVVKVVDILTKKGGQSYEEYLSIVQSSEEAMHVKIADLKDNMDVTRLTELTEKDIERLKKYHKAWLNPTT